MDSNKNSTSKKNYIIFITLATVAIVFAFLSTKSELRTFLFSNQTQTRQILAKVFADFSKKKFVIFKIKTESSIDIEIFEKDAENNQRLKQKFSLTDDSEAFLMINNNSVNLGLTDIDRDGVSDIIAPTVDRNGNSRLNIFKYNADLNQFVPAQAQD